MPRFEVIIIAAFLMFSRDSIEVLGQKKNDRRTLGKQEQKTMTAETKQTIEVTQIRKRIDEWANAFRSKDINRVMAIFAPEVVAFDLVPPVLLIQGGGEGAHEEDALLTASLRNALRTKYDVRYPQMPGESKPDMQAWKAEIAKQLERLDGRLILIGHSVGGSPLLKYKRGRPQCYLRDCFAGSAARVNASVAHPVPAVEMN